MFDEKLTMQVCVSQADLAATESDVLVILDGLGRNILHHLGNVDLGKPIRVFLRDAAGDVKGGATAYAFGGWVYISLLWVDESLRNHGYGTRLLRQIEAEAKRLGCRYAHLDTYSFEARPFYERLGYEVFAALEDYPAGSGHCKVFLKKKLV